jgi:hypothetical protein
MNEVVDSLPLKLEATGVFLQHPWVAEARPAEDLVS